MRKVGSSLNEAAAVDVDAGNVPVGDSATGGVNAAAVDVGAGNVPVGDSATGGVNAAATMTVIVASISAAASVVLLSSVSLFVGPEWSFC